MNKKPSVSIVIPAYNEEDNLSSLIKECFYILPKAASDYEVLVVDDASEDNTFSILENLQKKYKKLKIFRHKKNWGTGTGQANRTLYTNAKKDLIFWLPADGQIKPSELLKFLPFTEDLDIVIGWRIYREDIFPRNLLASLYRLLLTFLLGLRGTNDVDSVKLFKRKVFKSMQFESKSGFIEAEILAKAKKQGFIFADIPIRHYARKHGKQSGASLKVSISHFLDLFRLFPKVILWPRHLRLLLSKLGNKNGQQRN